METIETKITGFFNSLGLKLALIIFLTLLLLIPASMILNLIREREQRHNETIKEVTSAWGNSQTLIGPVLTIPYEYSKKGNKDDYVSITGQAHFLPENLKITGTVEPNVRNRGIYKVVTYRTQLHVSGNFTAPDLKSLGIGPGSVDAGQICLEMGIPDMRGLNKNIAIQWGDTSVDVVPGLKSTDIFESGVHAGVKMQSGSSYNFSYDIDLNGSNSLNFVPVGKETDITVTSSWKSPSFNGAFLPDDKKVDDKGFRAYWNVLQLNRNYPQQWINNEYSVNESSFGVELITPVDGYQKSERSAKYAILFIGLTFLIFFFAEVMTGTRIHAINYLLTGFGLCIFYSLLTALSEHISFNLAYLVAGVTIAGMTTAFTQSLYRKWQVTITVSGSLCALYVFLFGILQLEDYSLLFGNIGLVIILGIVMFYSRKIDWYAPTRKLREN